MTGEMNEVNRSIGALQASVENLTRTWQEQDRNATQGRRELYRKFEELKNEVTDTTSQVTALAKEFAEIKPTVVIFEQNRQRNIGARGIVKVLWAALVGLMTALAYGIHEMLNLLWPPKH